MVAGIGTLAVSFHGGATLPGINNVYAFSHGKAGRVMLGAPNAPDPGLMPALSELRAFVASSDGSFLFVANGSKDRNQVVRFTAGCDGRTSVGLPRRVRVRGALPTRSTWSTGSTVPCSSPTRTPMP